jgi:hypothetical protein
MHVLKIGAFRVSESNRGIGRGNRMTWEKAYWSGPTIAVLFHVLVFVLRGSPLFIVPGIIAYSLIGGVHGRGEPYDTISSVVEVLINAAMYTALIHGFFWLARSSKDSNPHQGTRRRNAAASPIV